ncbi:MAG: hypothetical protein JSS28_05920 [Proteobacteria bacterium]|nr:hypothetical protein [Pseudomonadota bacterium]
MTYLFNAGIPIPVSSCTISNRKKSFAPFAEAQSSVRRHDQVKDRDDLT